MSELNPKSVCFVASGVFKLDYKVAGYPDLKKVAPEWAKNPCFYGLIVRKVSESNFGIQFVYLSESPCKGKMKEYRNELENRFGKVYAVDYHESIDTSPNNDILDDIVVMKALNVN